jgi:hypothetical protein
MKLMGFRQWIFSLREYLGDYVKPLGFGRAAHTRLLDSITRKTWRCAPPVNRSFTSPSDKTLLIVAELLL